MENVLIPIEIYRQRNTESDFQFAVLQPIIRIELSVQTFIKLVLFKYIKLIP